MGVNLAAVVPREFVNLRVFRDKVLAFDAATELYQFLSILRTRDGQPLRDRQGRVTSHLNGLLFRTARLVGDFRLRPIFVFDGPPPALKRAEIDRRRRARRKAEEAYAKAVAAGDAKTAWSKAVMTARLTREMVEETKAFLDLLGLPWVQAPSEGEAEAAYLARLGVAWAAASKDFDALLFGAPRLARYVAVAGREWLPSQGRARKVDPEVIRLDRVLNDLGLTREQLVDAAILVGTDFHPGVKGIGPKKAVALLRKHGRLEDIPRAIRDRLPDHVDAIRTFFLDPPVERPPEPEWRAPDVEGVLAFLCDDRDFRRDRVEEAVGRLARKRGAPRTLDDFAP
jgi:flap endonuclease-1